MFILNFRYIPIGKYIIMLLINNNEVCQKYFLKSFINVKGFKFISLYLPLLKVSPSITIKYIIVNRSKSVLFIFLYINKFIIINKEYALNSINDKYSVTPKFMNLYNISFSILIYINNVPIRHIENNVMFNIIFFKIIAPLIIIIAHLINIFIAI